MNTNERLAALVAKWRQKEKDNDNIFTRQYSVAMGECAKELAAILAESSREAEGALMSPDQKCEICGGQGFIAPVEPRTGSAADDSTRLDVAKIISAVKSAIGMCVDEEPEEGIRQRLWTIVTMLYRLMESPVEPLTPDDVIEAAADAGISLVAQVSNLGAPGKMAENLNKRLAARECDGLWVRVKSAKRLADGWQVEVPDYDGDLHKFDVDLLDVMVIQKLQAHSGAAAGKEGGR